MATPCIIGYRDPVTNLFHTIHCYYDGYFGVTGRTLLNHYQDFNKVKELVALGNISQIKEKIAPDPDIPHSYDSPAENVTVAYHRDLGKNKEDNETLICNKWQCNLSYNYCFMNGEWYFKERNKENWIRLIDVIEGN